MSDINGVMIGGVIGIFGTVLGSVVGPFILQRQKDAADKKRKRAAKFEELVGAVVEHLHWINILRTSRISGLGNEDTLSPIVKIRAISDTYFPEFEELIQQLETTTYKYENWMLDAKRKRIMNEPNIVAGHEEIVKVYMEKRHALLTELRGFARREFQ